VGTKACCKNCKYSTCVKGSYLGSNEYWCEIQSGKKHQDYYCPYYERNKK